jgi:hypothetical protein
MWTCEKTGGGGGTRAKIYVIFLAKLKYEDKGKCFGFKRAYIRAAMVACARYGCSLVASCPLWLPFCLMVACCSLWLR